MQVEEVRCLVLGGNTSRNCTYQDDFNNCLLIIQNMFKLKTCKMPVFKIFACYSTVCLYFKSFSSYMACATHETKTWLSPSAKRRRNSCSRPFHVYQDLSTCTIDLLKNVKKIPARRCLNLGSPPPPLIYQCHHTLACPIW